MENIDYLAYSANEPMVILRRKYNDGESLYKPTPAEITIDEALADVAYLRYIFENAYSGYTYHSKDRFDDAFISMEQEIKGCTEMIAVNSFIDLIASKLSFICDGHLSLTTESYGKGFYKLQQTYVADIRVKQENGIYFCVETGEEIKLGNDVLLFPTISNNEQENFLVGIRSKSPIVEITITVGSTVKTIPVHAIASKPAEKETLVEEEYTDDVAIISCSSFVGNTDDYADTFFEIGKKI